MRLIRKIYSAYSLTLFALIFMLIMPVFALMIRIDKRHPIIFWLHRVWAWLFYTLSFLPFKSIYSNKFDFRIQYIFCANHFSYLDIPAIGINKIRPIFVGKHSLGKIPLFGYMYRNIHITINRENLKSSYDALGKCANELDKGNNLMIFPEGGIMSKNPPQMARFKDGAFRLAIEKQVSIVPVTIPYNWILLPDDGKLMLKRHKSIVVFHDPIETKGMSIGDIDHLKSTVFKIIDSELKKWNDLK